MTGSKGVAKRESLWGRLKEKLNIKYLQQRRWRYSKCSIQSDSKGEQLIHVTQNNLAYIQINANKLNDLLGEAVIMDLIYNKTN